MASLRAACVLAAAVVPASASQWFIQTTYSDSACTSETEVSAFELEVLYTQMGSTGGCSNTGVGSMEVSCAAPNLQTLVYAEADCAGSPLATAPIGGCEANGGSYTTMTCGALPSGMKELSFVTYAGANCTGAETFMKTAVKVGGCIARAGGTSEKTTMTATGIKTESFPAHGCTGTPTTEEMTCDTCILGYMSIQCDGLGTDAGHAATFAPSTMAAIVVLAGSMISLG